MRETRLYGSEGGGTEINRSFLPLYDLHRCAVKEGPPLQVASPVAWASLPGRRRRRREVELAYAHIPGAKAPGYRPAPLRG
jgi:hypothetical protein